MKVVILCHYCMDDKWIGDGRTPCPQCNPNGELDPYISTNGELEGEGEETQ